MTTTKSTKDLIQSLNFNETVLNPACTEMVLQGCAKSNRTLIHSVNDPKLLVKRLAPQCDLYLETQAISCFETSATPLKTTVNKDKNKKRPKSKYRNNINKNKFKKHHKSNICTFNKMLLKFISNQQKDIPYFPVIVISSHFIHSKIDFNNCIILSNPRSMALRPSCIIYDKVPFYIGDNIQEYLKTNDDIKVTSIKKKRLCILAKLSEWEKMETLRNRIWKYEIPDHSCYVNKNDLYSFDESLVGHYVLIASISNENTQEYRLSN